MIKLAYERVFNKLSNKPMIMFLYKANSFKWLITGSIKNSPFTNQPFAKLGEKEFRDPEFVEQAYMHNKIQPDWPKSCLSQLVDRMAIDRFQNFSIP